MGILFIQVVLCRYTLGVSFFIGATNSAVVNGIVCMSSSMWAIYLCRGEMHLEVLVMAKCPPTGHCAGQSAK